MRGLARLQVGMGLVLAAVIVAGAPGAKLASALAPVGFADRVFVDNVKAGGEPLVLHSTKAGNLVYTSHEGTTHLDRTGAGTSVPEFICPDPLKVAPECYQNHVWIWTSGDKGKTWQTSNEGLAYTGFSDPDLSEDAAGNIYNTGIDLANEAVFSSPDGGHTWPHGTTNCHQGDRPWLAGGAPDEVFMGTDDVLSGNHTVFYSNNISNGCLGDGVSPAGGVVDAGPVPNSTATWSGFGKLIYDRHDGSIIEPAIFNHPADATHSAAYKGVGYSRLPNAAHKFAGGPEKFEPHEVMAPTTVFSPFGAPEVLSMDSAENLYFAWDTDDRDPNGGNGCSPNYPLTAKGGPTPTPNHIMFAAGKHTGPGSWQFGQPVSLSHQGNAHVEWPWSVAGSPGNVSVVWYQMDQLVDPDCDLRASDGNTPVPDVKTYIYEAHITGAADPATFQATVTNASGSFVHEGGICNSGTTCVATGQDRRLGDFFTNAIDEHGCVMIASGDTTRLDAP